MSQNVKMQNTPINGLLQIGLKRKKRPEKVTSSSILHTFVFLGFKKSNGLRKKKKSTFLVFPKNLAG